jgi:hypothetical protein
MMLVLMWLLGVPLSLILILGLSVSVTEVLLTC